MILTGAKNAGKLFEEPAGAGWVRVERGVRPRGAGGTLSARSSWICYAELRMSGGIAKGE